MANIIHVSPEKLSSTATSFAGVAKEVKTITGTMTSTVQQLSGRVWSGEAASAYVNKFNGLQGDMNKLYNMIEKHSQQLQAISKEFSTAETQNTTEAGRLSNNVLS